MFFKDDLINLDSSYVFSLKPTVKDFIFSDFNYDQEEKVYAGNNSSHGEVWWFYCSASSTTNNKYVVFNYEQNVWYYGNIARTAWIDRGTSTYPIAAGTDNYLYYHENFHFELIHQKVLNHFHEINIHYLYLLDIFLDLMFY